MTRNLRIIYTYPFFLELPLTEIGMDFQRTFFEVCVENGFTADLTYKVSFRKQ